MYEHIAIMFTYPAAPNLSWVGPSDCKHSTRRWEYRSPRTSSRKSLLFMLTTPEIWWCIKSNALRTRDTLLCVETHIHRWNPTLVLYIPWPSQTVTDSTRNRYPFQFL